MKMLSNKQIKIYLKRANSKSKKAKKKAISRLKKDLNNFGNHRLNMCKKMLEELKREAKI